MTLKNSLFVGAFVGGMLSLGVISFMTVLTDIPSLVKVLAVILGTITMMLSVWLLLVYIDLVIEKED